MGYFARAQQTFVLKDGNQFTARKMTAGERAAIQDGAMKFVTAGQEMHFDTAKIKLEQLVTRLVSWEGEGFEGQNLTRQNVYALPPEIVDEMRELLDGWDTPLTAEEKKGIARVYEYGHMHGIALPVAGRYGTEIAVMKEMGWTYDELLSHPADMVEEIIERLSADSKWQHQAQKARAAKK